MRMCFCGQPVFSTDKITRIGYCKSHSYKRTDTDKRSIVVKAMSKAKLSTPTPIKEDVKVEKAEMDLWFLQQRKLLTGICLNCGQPSEKNNEKYWKWSCCHILPKKKEYGFPSVATNMDNCLELCIKCHTLFDRNWMTAAQMPVFNIAIEKFKKIYPFIAKSQLRFLPECLTQEIEP